MRRRIIVATDLSSGSDEAIVQGEARACRDRAALSLVYVSTAQPRQAIPVAASERQARATALTKAIALRVRELTGRTEGTFEIRIEEGPPHAALSRLAVEQHAVLVVGSSAAADTRHSVFSGTAENIAALGSVPLLVARPRRWGSCVLAVVGPSPAHDDALETALQEASLARRRLVLLHCLNTEFLSQRATDLMESSGRAPHSAMTSMISLRARQRLNLELSRRNVNADLRVADGDPEYLVPLFAKSLAAEILVIGPPEVGSATNRVAVRVMRDAPCPVLVARRLSVHHRGERAIFN